MIEALEALPDQIEQVLQDERPDQGDRARNMSRPTGMLFFGRQFNFPVALEGALKMKEITYLYAEGHPERGTETWHHRAGQAGVAVGFHRAG